MAHPGYASSPDNGTFSIIECLPCASVKIEWYPIRLLSLSAPFIRDARLEDGDCHVTFLYPITDDVFNTLVSTFCLQRAKSRSFAW